MQPDASPTSLATIKRLATTSECLFDLSLDGPRLRPVLFGYRSILLYESNNRSFVGEVAYSCWRITVYRKYFWGSQYYWLCNCNAIKKVLEYNVSIHQLKRWYRDLLEYKNVCLHLPNKMMKNVDGICRHIDH